MGEDSINFHLKRVDVFGATVKYIKLNLSAHKSVFDLLDDCREPLGFAHGIPLLACYEECKTILDGKLKLFQAYSTQCLVIVSEDTYSSSEDSGEDSDVSEGMKEPILSDTSSKDPDSGVSPNEGEELQADLSRKTKKEVTSPLKKYLNNDEALSIPLNVGRNKEIRQGHRISYQDFYVDRPYDESGSLSVEVIIDRLKYRTDVFRKAEIVSIVSDSDSYSLGFDDFDSDDEDNGSQTDQMADKVENEPFDLLLDLIENGNLSVQQEIFKRLLEQRYSVPLIFSYSEDNKLIHLKNALMFSKVKYLKEFRSIDEDTDLPRVMFLSECFDSEVAKSMDLTSQVFSCRFASKGSDIKHFSTMCELNVGFLKSDDPNTECPWMVLHVRGNYLPVIPYLKQFKPDAVLVEVDLGQTNFSFKENLATITTKLMSWGSNRQAPKYDKKKKLFTGPFHSIADGITKGLNSIMKNRSSIRDSKLMLKEIYSFTPQDEITGLEEIEKTVKSSNIASLRKRLILQKSLKKQGDLHMKLQFEREIQKKNELILQISKERKYRADTSVKYAQNWEELLNLFYQILLIKDEDLRFVLANYFEANIDKECASILEVEKCNVSQAYETYSESRKPNSLNHDKEKHLEIMYYEAKKNYVNKSVGIENIWREFINSYESAPLNHKLLPDLAAQYLIDGFALELMDGDTGMLCQKWTDDLFSTLQNKLTNVVGRTAKVFVVSVMGTQSTGKSTLLNIMFGCRMRVSAGQCTKGVYMQLIKSNFNKEFDYYTSLSWILKDYEHLNFSVKTGPYGKIIGWLL